MGETNAAMSAVDVDSLAVNTIRFLAGFRELCSAGLVMHHIYQEFSLTREGIERAATVPEAEVQALLVLATEVGLHE